MESETSRTTNIEEMMQVRNNIEVFMEEAWKEGRIEGQQNERTCNRSHRDAS